MAQIEFLHEVPTSLTRKSVFVLLDDGRGFEVRHVPVELDLRAVGAEERQRLLAQARPLTQEEVIRLQQWQERSSHPFFTLTAEELEAWAAAQDEPTFRRAMVRAFTLLRDKSGLSQE